MLPVLKFNEILKRFQLTYKPFGERSILIEWPSEISENILKNILDFKKTIQKEYIKEKVEIKSAYNSILVTYDFTINKIYDKISHLKSLYGTMLQVKNNTYKIWKIPVCYHEDFAIDLDALANQKELTKEAVIDLHSGALYTVYFIGFLPGFLYLGGLNEKLYTDRRKQPRLKVEKGAVAIGGKQTGFYPSVSPGGWHIIGNSPVNFFDASMNPPCFANPGDKIQCVPISIKQYHDIKTLVDAGVYQLESEVCHD